MGSWLPKGFEFLSGFPEGIRRKRIIVTLQAFFDDSGTKGTGQFMVMAGLFGRADVFAEIADEWDKNLRARHPGSIQYFKAYEALGLTGEFRHWQPSKRDEKIRQMAKVIDRDDIKEIAAVLDLHAFQQVFAEWDHLGGHHSLRQPYMLLYPYVLSVVVGEAVAQGASKPVEIIFDEHDVFRPVIADGYSSIRKLEWDEAKTAVLPIQPWFRDDKDFVVLQAADLLAAEARLIPEKTALSELGDICPKLKEAGHFKLIGEHDMRALSAFVKASLAQSGGPQLDM